MRSPAFLIGIATQSHLGLDTIIVGCEICIAQRPVQAYTVIALQRKVSFMHPQPHPVVVKC